MERIEVEEQRSKWTDSSKSVAASARAATQDRVSARAVTYARAMGIAPPWLTATRVDERERPTCGERSSIPADDPY